MPVQRILTNDHFSVKPMHEKKSSLLCESIIYDGADEVKMLTLSVHCFCWWNFTLPVINVCVGHAILPKMTYSETNILKITICIAYNLLSYWNTFIPIKKSWWQKYIGYEQFLKASDANFANFTLYWRMWQVHMRSTCNVIEFIQRCTRNILAP